MDKFINTDTGAYPLTEFDIKALHPRTGFPEPFLPAFAYYAPVTETEPPAFDPRTHKLVELQPLQTEGAYTQQWVLHALTPADVAARAAEQAAAEKAARDAARITITRTQGLLLLYRTQEIKESDIEAMIAEKDEAERYEASLYFRAATWDSDSPFVLMLCNRVGLNTPEKLRTAFEAAKAISA